MAKYDVKFSCGHTDTVILYGPNAERERKIEWYKNYGLCPACFKAQQEAAREAEKNERQEEYEAALANAKSLCLPELEGTEKQVRWAMVIRHQFLEQYQEFLAKNCKNHPSEKIEDLKKQINSILHNVTKASSWIENQRAPQKLLAEAQNNNTMEKEIVAETTIKPENCQYPSHVEIRVDTNKIEARYPLNEDFRQIVKKLGYTWDSDNRCWCKHITIRHGSIADRAAELGAKLLLAGFAVQIQDEEIRQKAISGSYEPEHKRWITILTSGSYTGWLCVSWEKGNEDIYRKARSLPGSKWDSPNVVVPVSSYSEVLDFANMLDFKLSPGAQDAIEAYRNNIEVVVPQAGPEKEYNNKLGEILQSSTEVLDDLKDE